MPFFEGHGFYLCKGGGAGDEEGEEVATVLTFHVGSGTCVFVSDLHLV